VNLPEYRKALNQAMAAYQESVAVAGNELEARVSKINAEFFDRDPDMEKAEPAHDPDWDRPSSQRPR
jgi:hypothetical protein